MQFTIIRPGGLKTQPATGRGVLTEDSSVCGAIHREDVADLLVHALFSDKTNNKVRMSICMQSPVLIVLSVMSIECQCHEPDVHDASTYLLSSPAVTYMWLHIQVLHNDFSPAGLGSSRSRPDHGQETVCNIPAVAELHEFQQMVLDVGVTSTVPVTPSWFSVYNHALP